MDVTIILNKTDLFPKDEMDKYAAPWTKAGYDIVRTSVVSGEGMDTLKDLLKGNQTLLVGASGVGKSTVLNKLIHDLDLDTSAVSEATGRGVHTTTYTMLYPYHEGGFVADTPGVREFFPVLKAEFLKDHFPEFIEYAEECAFGDCMHLEDEGCGVREAAARDDIHPDRYISYKVLYASLLEGPKRGRLQTQGNMGPMNPMN